MKRYASTCLVVGYPRMSFHFFLSLSLIPIAGCSIFASRPVQEMSYTSAAIRAAKEVQADTLAPELFRQANEWFFKAKHEYKFKNFKLAKEYTDKARHYAEQAEFESLRNGGNRTESAPPDTASERPAAKPYPYPTPEGTPAEVYEQKKAEEEKRKATGSSPNANPNPSPTF
jgi:hypothetical protein